MSFSPQSLWMGLESLLHPATLLTIGIRGVLLLAAAALLVRVTFKASAASRHLIWAMAMVALLLLPILSATLPALRVQGPAWITERWSHLSKDAQTQTPTPVREAAALRLALPANWVVPVAPRVVTENKGVIGPEGEELAMTEPIAQDSPGALTRQLQDARRERSGTAAPVVHPQSADAAQSYRSAVSSAASDAASDAASRAQSAASWLLPLWLVGLVAVAGWFAVQHWSVRWLTMHAVEVEEGELIDLMHRLRRHIELRRPVRLLVGHRTMMPMTWGVFHPVMLLPENISSWPASRQEDVLLHELAHIKRRDHLSQVLAQIGCALHWFNPLTWYAVRRMTLEREHACDDYVLNSGTRPSDYATNLLEVARSMKRGPVTSMAAIAMAGRSTLKDRLQAVLDEGRTRNTLGARLATLSVLLVGALAIPLATLEVVNVQPAQAAGPKVGDGRAPYFSTQRSHGRDPGGVIVEGDGMVMYHNGQRIELPFVDSNEVLAIVGGDLTDFEGMKEYYNVLQSVGDEIGMSFRELESNDGMPFHYFAFDDAARGAVEERLEELSDTLSEMNILVQPNGTTRYFNVAPAVDVPRAPRAPRAPRPPRVSVLPFQVANGSWGFHGKGNNNWTWNDGDDRMSLRTRGDIAFNDAGTDVESISPKGYFEFEMEDGKTDYRVRFRSDRDGELSREWWVDGDKKEYDDEARAWMAKSMPEMLRRTGFNAEQRVGEILKEKGVDGVLKEIDTLESDHVVRIYFSELLEQAKLDSKQYKQVFKAAGASISSDFELASLLAQSAQASNLDEDAIIEYAIATRSINSDFEQHRALSALVKDQKLTPKSAEAILDASMDIHSDFELASFLSEIATEYPQAYHSQLFLDALESVGSDFEQRRVLTEVVKQRDLSEENLGRVLKMAADGINSDFELAEFLTVAARTHRIQGAAVQLFLQALESIDSDFEYRRAATAAIRRGEMQVADVVELVKIAGDNINSDFELSELLQIVADSYPVEGDLRQAYLHASESINSQQENRRALDAIEAP